MQSFVANVKSPVGVWSVVGSDEGVTHIHLPQDEMTASKGTAPKPVADAVEQLKEYFAGTRRSFKVKLARLSAPRTFKATCGRHCAGSPTARSGPTARSPTPCVGPGPIARSATRITPTPGRSSCPVTAWCQPRDSVATAAATR